MSEPEHHGRDDHWTGRGAGGCSDDREVDLVGPARSAGNARGEQDAVEPRSLCPNRGGIAPPGSPLGRDGDARMRPPTARQIPFVLACADEVLLAGGRKAVLPEGPLASLAGRTRAFFASRTDGPDLLVGALPFDPDQPGFLIQPKRASRVRRRLGPVPGSRGRADPAEDVVRVLSVISEPSTDAFERSVEAALGAIEGGNLRKVVLARCVRVLASRPFSAVGLLRQLSLDDAVTSFVAPLPSAAEAPRALVGATPELLLEKRIGRVASHPLAGSARRRADPDEDRRAAERLLASEKDRREHAMVVEAVLDVLSPHCVSLQAPEVPALRATNSLWHLGTPITGRLRDPSVPSEHLVSLLHPTPAVCGLPRLRSRQEIGRLEAIDRGFYAGAVGWCDGAGDGRWFVSIRCAELRGPEAILYAGAGIVPGSTPEGELAETRAKFRAMLDGLGLGAQEVV